MRASISIAVEAVAGDDIDGVCVALVDLANRLQIAAHLSTFNGVKLIAHPGGSARQLAKAYAKVIRQPFTHREADSFGDTSAWDTLQTAVTSADGM